MLGINMLKLFGGGVPGGGSGGGGGGGGGGGSGSSGVNLTDASVVATRYAQWRLGADGYTYARITSGGYTQSGAWIFPQSSMNQFEVRATLADGDEPTGIFGAWLNCGTDRTWGWAGQVIEHTSQLFIEIRRISDSVVVDDAMISLYVSGTV